MTRSFTIIIFLLLLPLLIFAVEDDIQVTQIVTGCNNDGTCAGLETAANCPNDCEEETLPVGGGGPMTDKTIPGIYNLVIFTTTDSATVSWKTTEPARSEFYWGLTEEYEMGTVSEIDFLEEHKVSLFGLNPDTLYHFQIFLRDKARNEYLSYDQQFRTLVEADVVPPSNVSNFKITRIEDEEAAGLTWKNPEDTDFAEVRIVRSAKFFPADIYDGTTVYEGPGESAEDYDIETGITYYYSAFSYDLSGNYSSGAVALFIIHKPGVPIVILPVIPPVVPPEDVPLEIEKIELDYFDFFQGGKRALRVGDRIYLNGNEPFEIRLGYDKVPEILKTILVTLLEPEKEEEERGSFSFLLKMDGEGDAYQAKLGALKTPGLYEVSIAVLDYKNQALKKIKTFLFVEGEFGPVDGGETVKCFCGWWCWILLLIILLILLFTIYKVIRGKKENN